jgi:hypothetical protein
VSLELHLLGDEVAERARSGFSADECLAHRLKLGTEPRCDDVGGKPGQNDDRRVSRAARPQNVRKLQSVRSRSPASLHTPCGLSRLT